MKKKESSNISIVVVFLIVGIVSWSSYFKVYQAKDTVDINLFPKTIGEWSSKDLPISDTAYAILETRNAFVREYSNPHGNKVYLFIVYSENNRKVSHPPEICYTGGGATILEKTRTSIPVESQNIVLDVNRLVLEAKFENHVSYYWFKVGNSFTPSYLKQQILIAIKTILGRPASSALIRVSTATDEDMQHKPTAVLQEFSKRITPYLIKYLP